MQPVLDSRHQKSHGSGALAPCALWPVDLKLTHLDWNPEATLIHFQGQHLNICELDYNILHSEIQNAPKTEAAVDIGEFCLVEDSTSSRWFRGRIENQKEDLFDVFLIDHGSVLSANIAHISSCSSDLFILPPKIVCGFLANVLLLQSCSHSVVEDYLSSLIGRNVAGYIPALLPHEVLLLEAPDINSDLVRHGFGRHVDTNTFLFLVEMLTEMPLKQNIAPVPDLLIEKPRRQEIYFKSSGLQRYEDMLSFCGPRLSCGTRVKVRITAAVNLGLFYCQVASMETDLWEMSKKMTAICEYRTKECNQKTPENLGLLCSVKGKDGKWYRGFVQFLPVNSQVSVFFIDYGFFESVKVENVHKLPPELHSTPIMAFACSLSSQIDQDNVLKTQQLSFLKAGLLGGVLDVEISGFDEKQYLYSVTIIGSADYHVKEPEPIQKLPTLKVESVLDTEELSSQGGCLYYETVMGEALGKALEEEEVQVDSVFVGYVEYVRSPNHFWIRTQKRNDEFEEMMTKLTEHFSNVKLDEDVLMNPDLGTPCCALYENDMHFYRGVVIDTLEHGAEVLFTDFGNIEKVPHMLIKNIPETFVSKSPFAICCSLVNVFPLDDFWSSTASDFFRQTVSNKALLVHVVQMRKNRCAVDLFEMGGSNSQSIAELLISSKQAEYIPIDSVAHNNTRLTQWCATVDISGNIEQWKDCEEEEKSCNKKAEKAQAPASFKALIIKPGFEFTVRCSYISSPSDFWCQPLDMVPAFEELMDRIQHYYSTRTTPLQSGDSCCVAKSPQDGRWYRAFVIEKQRGQAKIMLVDNGCTVQVSVNNLQAIMPEYVSLEGQAFRCSLYNLIEPADPQNYGDWGPGVSNLLREFILNSGSGLKCKVVSHLNVKDKGLCHVVDLYNTQTQQSVTKALLEQGLVRGVTVSRKQQLTVFPESFVYSSYGVRPGNEERVYVTHVSSQGEVYCHLERNTEIIEELERKISEESDKMMKPSTKAVVRKLCLAKYFDGKWYRGLTRPVQSPLHLSVFFVDYGNSSISEKTNVMFIPRDSDYLLYTPMQAMRCSLDSVSTAELYADVKEWLNETVLNKLVRAMILGKNEDGAFVVQLFNGDVNINEKLKELILGHSHKPKTSSFNISSTKAEHHRRNISIRCRNPPKRQSSTCATSNIYRGDKKKENRTRDRTRNKNTKLKQGNEDKSKSCAPAQPPKNSQGKWQRENQDAKPERSPQSKVTQITRLSRLSDKNVNAGFSAKCFTSHVDSVNCFFLQLSEDEPAILKLGEDLNTNMFRDSLKLTTSLRIGDIVLAEYEEDAAVYRSVVKSYEGRSCVKVEFVDYGNSAAIGKEKIYSIPEEYLSQPRFSIPCSLLDKSMYKNDASFTDAVMEKPLMVDFVCQNGTHWEVKIEVEDTVGLCSALEAAVECSRLAEKEEKSPTSSCETKEKVRSFEKTQEMRENEVSQSEGTMSSAGCENSMVAPTPVRPLPKLKAKTRRRHRGTSSKTKRYPKAHGKTKTSSVKPTGNDADAFLVPPIRAKDTESGTLLSVQTDGSFYVRLTKSSDLLALLENHITDSIYKCKTVAGEDVKEGLKCLVQTQEENRWQRGVVQQIHEQIHQVFLVDHGIRKEFPSGSIQQQCSELEQIPNLAVLCKMNSLGFSTGEHTHRLWCETLKTIIGKEVKVVFVSYCGADNLWMVEIVMNGLFLIQQIEASQQKNEEKIPSPAETQNDGTGEGCTSDMSPPQQLVFAPVDLDKAYSGFAASVTTPFKFCVVLEDLLLSMNRLSIVLDELPGQMSSVPEAHLLPGTCCLLKSDSRNKWCRAEIVHVDPTVVLNLVDYGHYECMLYDDCSKLKKLPAEITNLPKVTYPCSLRGIKPVAVDGQWRDEATVFFQQCLYQKNLQIFFREFVSTTHWKVDILADGIHVAKELVDAGHASYMDVMLGLRFQEQSPCEALPRRSDCEEECGQEEKGSDETGRKMSLKTMSGSSQCSLM